MAVMELSPQTEGGFGSALRRNVRFWRGMRLSLAKPIISRPPKAMGSQGLNRIVQGTHRRRPGSAMILRGKRVPMYEWRDNALWSGWTMRGDDFAAIMLNRWFL
jgi:hypothetical protein